jgi:hypothetical protein
MASVNKVIDEPSTGPLVFDYTLFVGEVRSLIDRAELFRPIDKNRNSSVFKAWRHELQDLLMRIRGMGYTVNTKADSRAYALLHTSDPVEQKAKFESAPVESLIELRLVVRNFETYGDPGKLLPTSVFNVQHEVIHSAVETKPAEGQKWPDKDKVTLAWLYHNMPVSAWSVLVVVGAAGFAVASWQPIATLLARWAQG